MGETIKVTMLGNFSLSKDDVIVDDSKNRSRKVWALLAVLLCNHGRAMRQQELIDLLWGEDSDTANPVSALKTTLHRVRAILAPLTDEGENLILHTGGGYAWNDQIPVELDIEEFEQLCRSTQGAEGDDALALGEQALRLYCGTFLSRLSAESWVLPRSAYYESLYLRTALHTLELLQEHAEWEKLELRCRTILQYEPYQEAVYQYQMRALLAMGRQSRAVTVYEEMSRLLLSNFGVMPEAESRRLYREALRTVNRRTVPVGVIQEQLREVTPISGALVCDYDFFKVIYQAQARMVARSGDAVHIAMLSVVGLAGKELPRRSMETAVENLQEVIRTNLRKGDVVALCSPSQFVLMLPQANFENSQMVCERITRAFARKFPHSPAAVQTMVYPLEPSTN